MHSINNFKSLVGIPDDRKIRTLREFMEADYDDKESALACIAILVSGDEPYCNQTIANTETLNKGKCLVLDMQKNGFPILMPDVNTLIQKGDILWVMGSNNAVGRMAALSTTNSDRCSGIVFIHYHKHLSVLAAYERFIAGSIETDSFASHDRCHDIIFPLTETFCYPLSDTLKDTLFIQVLLMEPLIVFSKYHFCDLPSVFPKDPFKYSVFDALIHGGSD